MLLGTRIKSLRIEKGLTQDDLAEMINVTKSTISYYENSKRTPTVTNLHLLAEALNVSFDYLMGNDHYEVADSSDNYSLHMANEEVEFIKEIRRYTKLYDKMIEDPKRFIELINKKLS